MLLLFLVAGRVRSVHSGLNSFHDAIRQNGIRDSTTSAVQAHGSNLETWISTRVNPWELAKPDCSISRPRGVRNGPLVATTYLR